jgi:PQQ-dependent dehydrogenase (methanol/ethanol family)
MRALVLSAALAIVGAASAASAQDAAAAVDAERLTNAEAEPGQWMSYGRTYGEQRWSPLAEIDAETVGRLGLAWYADYDTNQPQESNPLFIDGVLYTSTAWSKVYAFDARTGEQLWFYDPKVPGEWNVNVCCGLDNRGVAAWDGKIYLGTLDGRLIALDAETGEEIWSVMTVDQTDPYSITMAPRVVKGRVLIGQSGAEMGVRGYVSAYDVETGEMDWRFYTVPGNPALGFENDAMRMAAETWTGQWWFVGGGGTVWDSIVYDPITDLVYVGVGNGSPWNQHYRSPEGGDNLFLSSIVALRPDTGEYVWHYQTTPGDTWDFTATQQIMIADLEVDGRTRRVLMQAPKNGFFYVLDAATGELISANAYATMNWATHVDLETGRPAEVPEARFGDTGEPFNMIPGPAGAHAWHPMAYSPETGLVYIPVQDMWFVWATDPNYQPAEVGFNLGTYLGAVPGFAEANPDAPSGFTGFLQAWDPVEGREVWRTGVRQGPTGGALATGGGLVFQGNSTEQKLVAYSATDGAALWSADLQTGVVAAPITYELDGRQYVAISVGGQAEGGYYAPNYSRLLVYALGGTAVLPEPVTYEPPPLDPPDQFASADAISHGAEVFGVRCAICHGQGGAARATFPDLRRSGALHDQGLFDAIVLEGVLAAKGMASFDAVLAPADTEALRAYLVDRAIEERDNPAPVGFVFAPDPRGEEEPEGAAGP